MPRPIILYPEYIKYVIDHPTLAQGLSSRFVLQTEEAHDFSQQLHLHVELSEGIIHSSQMEEEARRVCVGELPKISSEYCHLLEEVKQHAHPKVTALAYGASGCLHEERSENRLLRHFTLA